MLGKASAGVPPPAQPLRWSYEKHWPLVVHIQHASEITATVQFIISLPYERIFYLLHPNDIYATLSEGNDIWYVGMLRGTRSAVS